MTGKAGNLNLAEMPMGITIKDIIIAKTKREIFTATVNGIMGTGFILTGIITADTITGIIIPITTENICRAITSSSVFRCIDLLRTIQETVDRFET